MPARTPGEAKRRREEEALIIYTLALSLLVTPGNRNGVFDKANEPQGWSWARQLRPERKFLHPMDPPLRTVGCFYDAQVMIEVNRERNKRICLLFLYKNSPAFSELPVRR
uniref:Uncharacterized protein n=1 Tax=Guillardia theta TaxID=55529 RepID=A0A7S4KP24_GUITH